MTPALADPEEPDLVICHLDRLLAERGMTLAALAAQVGVTVVNLSILKNNRAKAIRFTTLTAVCDVLGCQPADLCSVHPKPEAPDTRVGDLDTQVRWRLVKACVSWRRHFVRRDHVHRSRDLGKLCDSEIVIALLHQLPMRQRTVLVLPPSTGPAVTPATDHPLAVRATRRGRSARTPSGAAPLRR